MKNSITKTLYPDGESWHLPPTRNYIAGTQPHRRINVKQILISLACLCVLLPPLAVATDQNELTDAAFSQPWTGDLDGMIQRRVIRALVAPSRTSYWLVGLRQTGAEYELLKAFENEINTNYKTQGKHIRIHVVVIPTSRDQLIPRLLEGRGDIAAGILTVTPERLQQVDFGAPFFRGVKEIAVTGPASPELASVDDLSGKEVFVRKSSSYWTHLESLNERFKKEQAAGDAQSRAGGSAG